MHSPTGQQFTIRLDAAEYALSATVTEVAASLRELRVNEVDLVETFGERERPQKGQGIVMAPWPGRVKDATWQYRGEAQQLAVTNRAQGSANHGLLRYSPYRVVAQTQSLVTLAATIYPQTGFPFLLDTSVTYALSAAGLTVTHEATNRGAVAAPWACGAHPYLRVGDADSRELTVRVPASSVFVTDDRQNPVSEVPVDAPNAPGADLRAGQRLDDLDLDVGYGNVTHRQGRAVSSVMHTSGRGVHLWQDEAFGYVVVYTPRNFARATGEHQAVAIEPMSAPANALNSGTGIVWLEPGQSWQGAWGITPVGFER